MDSGTISNASYNLAAVLAELVEDQECLAASALPVPWDEQLRWIRTLQQAGRDIDAIAEVMVILLRRLRELSSGG